MANYLVHMFDSDTYLCHKKDHKYIKKYMVRGKWRYVYADNATHNRLRSSLASADESARLADRELNYRGRFSVDTSDPTNTRDTKNERGVSTYYYDAETKKAKASRDENARYLLAKNRYDRKMADVNKIINNPSKIQKGLNWLSKVVDKMTTKKR